MKKKCMAVGGTAKKPASMEEQLAGIRGKVRPGYQAGGTIYRNGSTFSDQQIGEPMKGIASAGMSGQVDNMLDRTKAMPGSITSAPQPYAGSVIPVQSSQQAMRAATNFGMTSDGTAPAATSQTISTGDYSAGPRQGGFVDEYGKPRTTPAQDAQAEAAARQAEIAARSKEQIDNIANMKGLSDRQRVAAVSGIAANASRSGVGTDIAGAIGTPMNQLSNKQQLRVSQAQYGVNMEEDGLTPPTGRGYRRGYAGGGIVDSIIRTVGKILPESSGEKYEPGIQSRAAEDPARHGRSEALNPRTQTASTDAPHAGGFQEEAERRRKQMRDAMNYEAGGMVKSKRQYAEGFAQNIEGVRTNYETFGGGRPTDEVQKKLNAGNDAAHNEVRKANIAADDSMRREKRGMASGGMVRFAGKGGPRDDKIPVKVAGQEINVSNGENAVILPAKTAANPAALYAIGGIIQATNDGRKPKMGMEKGGSYKDGAYPYDDRNPPTAQEVYAGASPAGIVQAITPDSWRTARVVAPAGSVGGGMSSSGTDPRDIPAGGTITNLAPALQQIHNFAKPAYDLSPSMRALGTVGYAVGNVFADSAEAQRQGTTYGAAREARIASEGRANAAPYSNEGRPSALGQAYQSYNPPAQGITAGVANADARMQNVAANDGMTTTQMGAGFDPTKLQMADGYGMATNASGKTIAAGNAEYVGADGRPTSRWTDTQQYKDAIARNEADKLRLAEMQAQRLGADPMAVQKASQGIAGGVLDARTQEAVLQRNAQIQSLVAKAAAEPDQGKRQQFIDAALAMQGKDNKQEKNLQVVDLGSESAPDGMGGVKAIPRGQELYDANTKQWVPRPPGGAPQTNQQAEGIKSQLAAGKISREKAIEELRKIGFQ